MSPAELKKLAADIRLFLLDKVSKSGGHLASNLGIVEIAIGLHYLFDSPTDRILWDVGHQSYVHKILTGRAGNFSTLRQMGGMSGFPKRSESVHDVYDAGHASTSLSAALGMAKGKKLRGEKGEILAVIGDGAMTGGPAFEALNNVGTSGSKIIIVLNDNGMSISRNIGGIARHLAKLRTSSRYLGAKNKVKGFLENLSSPGKKTARVLTGIKDRVKYALMSGGVIFEELGITYLGPFDGNDLSAVLTALEDAKKAQGPVLVHFITKKGKGYTAAERTPGIYHGVSSFDLATGVHKANDIPAYSAVFGEALLQLADEHPDVIGITAAMMNATGLSSMKQRYPERVVDVGIAEAHAVIYAAGAALSGLRPVVAIYSSFLQRAYDEIIEDVALQDLPVIFAIDRAGIVGQDGETHHGIFDLAYLLPVPGLRVLAPCDGRQLKEMLSYAYACAAPVAVRYPRGTARGGSLTGKPFNGENTFVEDGKDAVLLAVGTMLETALYARKLLQKDHISLAVYDVAVVKPFDVTPFAKEKRPLFTLEDGVIIGGFGERFAARIPRKVTSLGWADRFVEHGKPEELYHKYGLDAEGVAASIKKELAR